MLPHGLASRFAFAIWGNEPVTDARAGPNEDKPISGVACLFHRLRKTENAMTLRLHVFPFSPRAFKVLLVANHLGLDYETKTINLLAGEQRSAEFTALNVNQRMPVLEDGGYRLWESNAIIEYLAAQRPEAALLPADTRGRLQITKWLYWDSAHWDQAVAIFTLERIIKKLFNRGEASEAEIARGTALIDRLAKVLDGELAQRRYVAGDSLTLADFALAPAFQHEDAQLPLTAYPAIQRWAADMKSLPAWSKTAASVAAAPAAMS